MARLADICAINMGQSPDSSTYNEDGNGLPFFQGNADFGVLHPSIRVWCSAPTKIAKPNDILISVRAPIGALNIADIECCIGRGLAALTVNPDLCTQKYLWYGLESKVEELNFKGTGSTFKAISKNTLFDTEIPLPSLTEQTHIAVVLDKVSELITLRKQQLDKLDELVKARFVEMFGDPVNNTMKWDIFSWEQVFDTTTGRLDSNAATDNGKYPFFTCAKDWLWIDSYAFDCEALLLAGNNAAGVYDVKYYNGKFNAYQRTYVLKLLNAEWQYSVFKFQLENRLSYLQSQSKGTNTRYLTLGILNSLTFMVPPNDLQNQFSLFVTQVDKYRLTIQQGLDKLETMKKALMQIYFR